MPVIFDAEECLIDFGNLSVHLLSALRASVVHFSTGFTGWTGCKRAILLILFILSKTLLRQPLDLRQSFQQRRDRRPVVRVIDRALRMTENMVPGSEPASLVPAD